MDNDYINSLLESDKHSSQYIANNQIKDRNLFPYFPTTIIDNFYDEPDLWREFALDQEFFKGKRGSWPGLRTKLFHENNLELFELFGKKLLFWIKDYGYSSFTEFQTAFHMVDDSYGRGWVHDDDPKLNIAGVIYLNKTAPLGSGTVIYEDQNNINLDEYADKFMKDVLSESAEDRKPYQKYREEQTKLFKKTITMESVYNRCIMFDTRAWHSAEEFFGNSKETNRLTQVFFVKAI